MTKLKQYFSYKKFAGPSYRILYLDGGYYLQKESIEVLKKMGHQVTAFTIGDRDPRQMLGDLLKASLSLKPDCIMGINHGGFDPEGKIADILSQLSIPVIFWYLDDFRFIILNGVQHANDNTIIFTFEKNHVPLLKQVGFQHVFYLPSATALDPEKDYTSGHYGYLSHCTTFVGDTFENTKMMRFRPHYNALLAELNNDIEFHDLHDDLVAVIVEKQGGKFTSTDDLYHYAGFVIAHATQVYRQYCIQNLRARELHIFGDDTWRDLNVKGHLHPPTDDERETPSIYRHSLINVNVSSQQLETTVNLRIFDVPVAGGFLLTDWRDSLDEMFDTKEEIVHFTSVGEANDLIAFYEQHPHLREKIVKRAKERVEKEHLLEHRIAEMLATAKTIFN